MILAQLKAYGAIAAALVLGGLLAVQTVRLHTAQRATDKVRTELLTEQRDRSDENKERMRVALDDARETFRKGEIHASNQQEIIDAHAKQERARAAALAAAAADGERLRQQVTEFAATCGGREAQSPAAALQHCRDRAATLGVLYREADGQAEEFAGAAEKHADEVRTLKRVIENDRALLPPGGVGLRAPPIPSRLL